jgi:hypothetical protein
MDLIDSVRRSRPGRITAQIGAELRFRRKSSDPE